jgi:2-polyprenyl-3-methyl-5-hydroxy-6-metoxy-1,4-benzoquinol methylase
VTPYEQRLYNALAEQHRKCFDPERKALRHEAAQPIDCPVCDSPDKTLLFTKDWFTFSRCNRCAMVYLDPRLTEQATYDFYNSEWNAIYNEAKFDAVSTSTTLDDQINRANLELIVNARGGARGELLEIGFASGVFLRAAKAAGFRVHGLELNERNYRKVKDELGPTMLNVDLFRAELPSESFDVIYMRDVFEHVPEPKAMLRELHRIAKPGCLLYIEVPNIEGLIYKIVKERHVCVFGFEHLNYWSPATLKKILELTGFGVRETRFASLDFTVGDVLRHYFVPTHTTLYPPAIKKAPELLLRTLDFAFRSTPLRQLDRKLTPKVADWLQRGSVVKVLAEKQSTP